MNIKAKPILFSAQMVNAILAGKKTQTRRLAWAVNGKSKYVVGDTLWVRESWRIAALNDNALKIDYLADQYHRNQWLACPPDLLSKYREQSIADAQKADIFIWKEDAGESPLRVRPSIFMPRFASRITLEVNHVVNQKLSEMTEQNYIAEGVANGTEFKTLWESIHGLGSWSDNTSVWAYSFNIINKD